MKKNRIWVAIFGLYCAVMLWLLFGRAGYVEGIPYGEQLKLSLVPFRTIRLFLDVLDHPQYWMDAVVNLFGNVIMFIPLGFLLPKVIPKLGKLWKTLLTSAAIVIAVEVAQLLTLLGTCDTDDLILNVIGAAIGYGIFKITIKTGLSG